MTRDNSKTTAADPLQDAALAPYLAAARAAPPAPPDALMARILADAQAEQPGVGRRAQADVADRFRLQRVRPFLAALGGRAGMGGLTTAALAGLWIGFAAPGPVAGLMAALPVVQADAAGADETDSLVIEMLPDFDDYLAEG